MDIPTLIKSHLWKQLPTPSFTVSEETSANGLRLAVAPTNRQAAQMVFWFAGTQPVDLLFGRAFSTELESPEPTMLFELIDAAIAGRIADHLWTVFGRTIYSKSEVITKGGRLTVSHGIPFIYPFWLRHDYNYSPYIQ